MKKLFVLLASVAIFASCSDPVEPIDPNAPTSFVFEQTIENGLYKLVAAYYDDEGYCWKLADLGNVEHAGQQTPEVIVEDPSITEVFLFSGRTKTDRTFTLIKHKKNIFLLTEDLRGITFDEDDIKNLPQERIIE